LFGGENKLKTNGAGDRALALGTFVSFCLFEK
jgi:hypothetical protein